MLLRKEILQKTVVGCCITMSYQDSLSVTLMDANVKKKKQCRKKVVLCSLVAEEGLMVMYWGKFHSIYHLSSLVLKVDS